MGNDIDWRSLNIRRDREFEPLVDSLVHNHPAIFSHIKDLMVFAAMVGFSEQKRESLSRDTISILLSTYATDQQDGFIYMISLIHTEDGNCLRDEELQNSIKIFEEYCRGGLLSIQSWINNEPTTDPTEILLSKIFEQFMKHKENDDNIESIPMPDILK